MPQINLLPWREAQREMCKKQFLTSLGLSVVFAVCVMGLIHTVLASRIRHQRGLNQLLKNELGILNQSIASIRKLRKKRQQLITRMTIIQKLQGSRPSTVRLFDEIVRILPDGIYFSEVKRQGSGLFITGKAQSNASISELMRQIEQSEWFDAPLLTEINKENANGVHESYFQMQLRHTHTSEVATSAPSNALKQLTNSRRLK